MPSKPESLRNLISSSSYLLCSCLLVSSIAKSALFGSAWDILVMIPSRLPTLSCKSTTSSHLLNSNPRAF